VTVRARFVHTNLVAHDVEALAAFYRDLFGCVTVPPVRDYAGPELERGTGVPGARLAGVHLRLPGWGADGPTLEIYSYRPGRDGDPAPPIDRPGFGHIAFEVDDVDAAREAVLAAGGAPVGEVVELAPAPDRVVRWCYVRDPEGNAVELQAWRRVDAAGEPCP
jgi:catechol 2,3-dioxygenase-like lactoylglutathione lyase family enzyme